MMSKMKLLLLLCLMGSIPLPGAAEEQPGYDRISLSVAASEKVGNDTLNAILYFQAQGRNISEVSDKVNQVIAWGVDHAARVPDIDVQTLDYQTRPLYQDGKPTGSWLVRHSIRLESRDAASLSSLLGELQKKLAIQHIGYRLSPDKRRHVEDALIKRVITRFKQRAHLVAQQFDAGDFRIVSLSISSSGEQHRPIPMMRTMAMSEPQEMAAPVLESGEQTIQVGIDGVIELLFTREP